MTLLIPIALILVGLILLAMEVYLLPGIQILGALGIIAVCAGVVYAFMTLGPLGGVLALAGAIACAGAFGVYVWQTGALDRLVLKDALNRDEIEEAREADSRARYLGSIGTAVTPLRPTGVVDVDGERLEVLTEGAFISAGSSVKIVAMDRRRYFVRLATEKETAPDNTSTG